MPLSSLQPAALWRYFYCLTQIPRPSHQEEAVQQFVLAEAARLGLWAQRDGCGNVLVRKPAAAGFESAPGIILQSHLDMVAQKNADTVHDFSTDPIRPYIDGGRVRAKGTTLGADNGIGAAAALAVLADETLQHGALEALFTATEETGMDGAKGLRGGWLQGDILLNLDSETLGEICIGCAGGADGDFSLPLFYDSNSAPGYRLQIRGLCGGHSGIDIGRQRGNALKILIRLLHAAGAGIQLADISGGSLRNAIPREADALFASALPPETLQKKFADTLNIIRRSLPDEDAALRFSLQKAPSPEKVWRCEIQQKTLAVLHLCPDGVERMSNRLPGVVETSVNLAHIRCENGQLHAQCLLRSLDDAARDHLGQKLCELFALGGGCGQLHGGYPGWQPVDDAPITRLLQREGEKLLGKKVRVGVIHAGLECGLLARNYPHWQMASFGPTITMPHSPDESVDIASVEKFWQWLLKVLAAAEELAP